MPGQYNYTNNKNKVHRKTLTFMETKKKKIIQFITFMSEYLATGY